MSFMNFMNSGGGSLISSAADTAMGFVEHEWAHQEAREARRWQSDRADRAMQIRVADLQAAGLNPMLAITQGAAPVPGGAVASPTTFAKGSFSASASAAAARRNVDADTRIKNAQADLIEAQAGSSGERASIELDTLRAQRDKLVSDADSFAIKAEKDKWDISNNWELERDARRIGMEYQKMLLKAEALGIPEKEASAKFWSAVPESKLLEMLKKAGLWDIVRQFTMRSSK